MCRVAELYKPNSYCLLYSDVTFSAQNPNFNPSVSYDHYMRDCAAFSPHPPTPLPNSVPPATPPQITVPPTTPPQTTVPSTTPPQTTVPPTTAPQTTVPPTTPPQTTVPPTTPPQTSAPSSSIFSSCVDNTDCAEILDAECRYEKCQCLPGLSHDQAQNSCIQGRRLKMETLSHRVILTVAQAYIVTFRASFRS